MGCQTSQLTHSSSKKKEITSIRHLIEIQTSKSSKSQSEEHAINMNKREEFSSSISFLSREGEILRTDAECNSCEPILQIMVDHAELSIGDFEGSSNIFKATLNGFDFENHQRVNKENCIYEEKSGF